MFVERERESEQCSLHERGFRSLIERDDKISK